MKYAYRLVEQLFVVENRGHLDAVYWNLERFTGKFPYPISKKSSYRRSRRWLKENHPEMLI